MSRVRRADLPKLGDSGGRDRAAEAGRATGKGGGLALLAEWIAEAAEGGAGRRRKAPGLDRTGGPGGAAFKIAGYHRIIDGVVQSCAGIIRRDTLPREVLQLRGAQLALPMVRSIGEAYGWDKARAPTIRPTAVELARLELVFDWALRLGGAARRLVMARASGASFADMARLDREGRSKDTVRRAYYAALDDILMLLLKDQQDLVFSACHVRQK